MTSARVALEEMATKKGWRVTPGAHSDAYTRFMRGGVTITACWYPKGALRSASFYDYDDQQKRHEIHKGDPERRRTLERWLKEKMTEANPANVEDDAVDVADSVPRYEPPASTTGGTTPLPATSPGLRDGWTTMASDIVPGDVVQIVLERGGLIGAFAIVDEVKSWGVQAYIHHVNTFEESSQIWLRLNWQQIEKVGRANLVPVGVADDAQ